MASSTTVYYDGLCPICSREIAHYRGKVQSDHVSFVDIADENFNPTLHGLDFEKAQRILHVKVGENMRTGIDAAIALWDAVPSYRWLARFMNSPGIHGCARAGYWVFAK